MEFDPPKADSIAKVISPRGLDISMERNGGPQFPVPDVRTMAEHEERYKAGEDRDHALKPGM